MAFMKRRNMVLILRDLIIINMKRCTFFYLKSGKLEFAYRYPLWVRRFHGVPTPPVEHPKNIVFHSLPEGDRGEVVPESERKQKERNEKERKKKERREKERKKKEERRQKSTIRVSEMSIRGSCVTNPKK